MLASELKVDGIPDRDTVEYVEWCLAKNQRPSDAGMVVDWVPHIKNLLGMVKELKDELERFKEDYDLALETIRRLREK